MTGEDRHGRMDATGVYAELTVHELWLRYVGIGGPKDGFHFDGYPQGVLTLENFQADPLAHVLNEAFDELYWAHHIPSASQCSANERLVGIIADQPVVR